MKILLTAIFKDDSEIDMAKRMLESFMPHHDGLAVALTGTSGEFDKLKALIKSYKGRYVVTSPETHPKIYHEGKFANFAEARNVSWELASEYKGFDWWTWADVDDVLISGKEVREAAKMAKKMKMDTVFFSYWYAVRLDEKGNLEQVIIDHQRERLIRPGVFHWISRLHEVTVPKDENYQPKHTTYDVNPKEGRKCAWMHLPGEDRSKNNLYRNIEILELQLEEQDGKDPRTRFYLGKTYIDLAEIEQKPKLLDKAVKEFKHYLKTSGWAEERGNAWEYLGNIYDMQGEHFKAISAYHKCLEEHPKHHIPYLRLSKKYADIKRYEESDHWLDVALSMKPPESRTTIGNPLEIKLVAASLMYNKHLRENKIKDAIYWLDVRNKFAGIKGDEMMKTLKDIKKNNDAAKWVFKYAKWLKDKGHTDKIKHLLKAIAPEFKEEQFVQYIANEVQDPKTWGDKSVIYFAGPTFEPWSDLSMSKGLGGSETAIVMLSREWAKLGYDVTVFCDTPDEGKRKGVDYRHWSTFNWNDKFNTLIVWRNPAILDSKITAKNLYYDAHDIEAQTNWTEERMKRIDKVFFKSEWHRKHVPKLPDSKAQVISNGIL